MNALVTGSHAYGQPTEKSDIDLVVLVSEQDLALLKKMADKYPTDDGRDGRNGYKRRTPTGWSLRFGKLNLLCVRDEGHLAAWRYGTEVLRRQKPVTRVTAVTLFGRLREQLIEINHDNGDQAETL